MAARRRAIVLKVTLLEVDPPVWRRFAVAATVTLPRLHGILQEVMGWQDCHLHQFFFGDECYGPTDPDWPSDMVEERGKRLSTLLARSGDGFTYEYDFGDGWRHRVEAVGDVDAATLDQLPVCLDGARACPPEDCGGTWGYEEFLDAIGDPAHEEHEGLLEWVGGGFDAEAFDRAAVNDLLRRAR